MWQSSQAVLVGLQEVTTSRKGAGKAGGQASNVCGDVGEDTWCGLVVVGDLKQNTSGHNVVQQTTASCTVVTLVLRVVSVRMH